ncbi:SUN domain-containing protein 5 [Gracilinanus agilis]|uniref:SUN domain-containing protein 5 n=1 Tax=Gracilinanus agilis TaxID=191870 RepID=UPI001CFC9033|nr:SUN domain-containing protein 5 [Gracilinanus agilis]
MRRSQRVHSIDCSNSAENESDVNPTSLTRSRRPSHQITPSVSENFTLDQNRSDSFLINRTSERSATQDVAPQLVTTVVFPSCRSLLSWLIQMIYFFYTLRFTVFKAQLCPKYTGWTQTGKALKILFHKLLEKLAILFICVFVFWCITICLPTKLNTGRTSMRTSGEVKASVSSLKDLRLYQEKVRKHTEEIKALHSLMEELSAKVQEVKVMSNEDLVAQSIMKKIQGDYIEKPDFALKSIGGTIDFDRTSATYSYDKARSYWSWFRLWNYAHSPEVILEPNVTPQKSQEKQLRVEVEAAALGLVRWRACSREANSLCKAFNYIKLKILTNWGNPHFTCLYRVRAHGTISRPAHDH